MGNESEDLLKRVLAEVLDGRQAQAEGLADVRDRLDSFRDVTLSSLDGVFHRIENVESELRAVTAGVRRLEVTVEGDGARRESLRAEITHLKERLTRLEARLAALGGDSSEPR